ncbi:MAG TPA: PadR family transcriptional regulator [Gemmatimonadales bacterium]|nr:PadR family transcriptional regulator [Gemmatimonadales bacterium]
MALDHILLGILRTPASGYQIKQQFDQVFSHFWATDLPQIYRTLNRMQKDGLLMVQDEPSDRGPVRKVYSLTPAGANALREWLTTAPTRATERIGFLAQTFFLGALEDDRQALEFMHGLRRELDQELDILHGVAKGWAAADPNYPDCADRDEFYAQLTLDHGIHKLTTKAAWASRCIRRIEDRLKEARDVNAA